MKLSSTERRELADLSPQLRRKLHRRIRQAQGEPVQYQDLKKLQDYGHKASYYLQQLTDSLQHVENDKAKAKLVDKLDDQLYRIMKQIDPGWDS